MVLFGILGLRPMSPGELVFFLCLPPGALGLVAGIGFIGKWAQHVRARWNLAHTFYALTDRRAIVGSDARVPGEIAIGYFTSDMFDATLCVEYRDGSGDVFFVQDGDVTWPEWGFRGISRPTYVEGLVPACPAGGRAGTGLRGRVGNWSLAMNHFGGRSIAGLSVSPTRGIP